METGKAFAVTQIAGTLSNFDRNPSARLVQMDVNTNLPVKIDVFEASDVTSIKSASALTFELKYTYPDSFNMTDLSPSSYDEFLQRLLNNEAVALDFNQ